MIHTCTLCVVCVYSPFDTAWKVGWSVTPSWTCDGETAWESAGHGWIAVGCRCKTTVRSLTNNVACAHRSICCFYDSTCLTAHSHSQQLRSQPDTALWVSRIETLRWDSYCRTMWLEVNPPPARSRWVLGHGSVGKAQAERCCETEGMAACDDQ